MHDSLCRKAALFFVALLLPAAVLAADAREHLDRGVADPLERETLINEGRSAAFFCANCHGEEGNSRLPDVPNLAGQNPIYILNQIQAFVTGKRQNAFMEGLMKVLNEREKAAIAMYFSSGRGEPAVNAPGPLAMMGEQQYLLHCASCHRPDAHGAEQFPRLAGQQPEYLRASLTRYLRDSGERNYPAMTEAVRRLGESNIEGVVQYLSSLR